MENVDITIAAYYSNHSEMAERRVALGARDRRVHGGPGEEVDQPGWGGAHQGGAEVPGVPVLGGVPTRKEGGGVLPGRLVLPAGGGDLGAASADGRRRLRSLLPQGTAQH